MRFNTEVIVSTYNNPFALNLTLLSLSHQTRGDFSVCVADDGSKEATSQLIEEWRERFGVERLRHVWHPDNGFQKNVILNKAIASSTADYLIFMDGDCIAAKIFVARHMEARRKGFFLSGGMCRMPASVTPKLNEGLITSGAIFSHAWLRANNCLTSLSECLKASLVPRTISDCLELLTPVKCTWNGANSSGWRDDILRVNGFEETMAYGSEDVELGYRLNNIGVKCRHVRYSATLLHIDHARPYADRSIAQANKIEAKMARKTGKLWAISGIKKDMLPPLVQDV